MLLSEPDSTLVGYGYCHCLCGQKTNLAPYSDTKTGYTKGEPRRYLVGHARRKHVAGESPNPEGLCLCGCGEQAPIATRTYKRNGSVKGQPLRFLPHHRPGRHILSEVDSVNRVAVCAVCGPVKTNHDSRCSVAVATRFDQRYAYRRHKQDACARCGFVAEHPTQLDVHHIDNDKGNGDPSNLQTLCANCHRLVTALGNHNANK